MRLETQPALVTIETFLIEDLVDGVDNWLDEYPSDDDPDRIEKYGEIRYIIKLIKRRLEANNQANSEVKEVS